MADAVQHIADRTALMDVMLRKRINGEWKITRHLVARGRRVQSD